MNKKVFSLCLGAVLLLLASCSGGYSSKEIDGVEFTGEGVFGDMTKYNFGNYREGRMFWSLELFRVDTNQRCLFMKPQIRTDAKVYY